MQENVSQFGKLVTQYDTIRPSYPEAVLRIVREAVPTSFPKILDIGCGTGISTRQLAETGALVIGCDIDIAMITAALTYRQRNTAYIQSEAGSLPFSDATFDLVTAFTAFHWFCDDASVREITRVLTNEGIFCTVQPEHTAPFAKDYRRIINKRYPGRTAPQYSTRDFSEAITSAGLRIVRTEVVSVTHIYPLEEFLTLVQSYSTWNQVPDAGQNDMVDMLRSHYATKLEQEHIHDTVDFKIILAKRGE